MLDKRYVIRCDNGLCSSKVEGGLKGDLKAKAKGLGWSFQKSFWGPSHVCPGCQLEARNAR